MEHTATDTHRVAEVLQHAMAKPKERSLPLFLLHLPLQRWKDGGDLRKLEAAFKSRENFEEFRENFEKLRILQAQVSFYRALKRLMSVWRVLHVVLALCLVVMIAAHIGFSLFLGYRWIFT
jgi:hypothetical protein